MHHRKSEGGELLCATGMAGRTDGRRDVRAGLEDVVLWTCELTGWGVEETGTQEADRHEEMHRGRGRRAEHTLGKQGAVCGAGQRGHREEREGGGVIHGEGLM